MKERESENRHGPDFAQVVSGQPSDRVYAPPPTEAQLDEAETRLGYRFPASYRAFMTRFGPGRLAYAWTLRPITLVAAPQAPVPTVADRTFHQWGQESPRPGLARCIYFTFNHYCEQSSWEFVFNTADITQVDPLEYRLWEVNSFAEEMTPAFASFHEFLSWLAEESWERGDTDFRPDCRGIVLHEPMTL